MYLLKKLYGITSPSYKETAMSAFIQDKLRAMNVAFSVDKHHNIMAMKGAGPEYPCVVCHMDEVHTVRPADFRVVTEGDFLFGFSPELRDFVGIGADDKNGIWICLKLLKECRNVKCVFFVEEEVGCGGSTAFDLKFLDDCRFVIECDRKGSSDLITEIYNTELCSEEFINDLPREKFGYKEVQGILTDVYELKRHSLPISCMNVSCGYYNPHTGHEMTNFKELLNCFKFVKWIVQKLKKVYPHEYVAPKTPKKLTSMSWYRIGNEYYNYIPDPPQPTSFGSVYPIGTKRPALATKALENVEDSRPSIDNYTDDLDELRMRVQSLKENVTKFVDGYATRQKGAAENEIAGSH